MFSRVDLSTGAMAGVRQPLRRQHNCCYENGWNYNGPYGGPYGATRTGVSETNVGLELVMN